MFSYVTPHAALPWRAALCRYSATIAGSPSQFATLQRAVVHNFRSQRLRFLRGAGIQPCMNEQLRELAVAPDRFEVVADDAILVAELRSAMAVCVYDAVEEAGALLHLRFIVRGTKPADVTDTTLATELLLLDRCIEALRDSAPQARNLQAKIAAHLPEDGEAQRACGNVLTLVSHFLGDAGISVGPTDASGGGVRHLRFRPCMGWLQVR